MSVAGPSKTAIVAPIPAPTVEAMADRAVRAVARGAQGIELRVDALAELGGPGVGQLVEQVRSRTGSSRPLIVTCRDKREGGLVDHPLAARIEAWTFAIGAGADFVDVELENIRLPQVAHPIREALGGRPQTRLIVSAHSWDGPFASPQRLYEECRAVLPGAVPKLVYTARHINDCLDALDLLHGGPGDKVVFCMGQAGSITRLLAKKLGGLMTYASLDPGSGTAPGQIPIDQMKGLYRADSIDEETEVYGVIGDPVAHSMSPAIHNACFADLGMNRLYVPLWVAGGRDELFRFLDAVRERPWLGLRGLSVTIPHKHSALEYAQVRGGRVDPLSARIGAANTLLFDLEGGIQAFNTDYVGAMEAIASGLGIRREDLKGWPVAVVGAGGVARAVVAGLCDAGARVTIYNRTLAKARALAQDFGCAHAPLKALGDVKARLLVNCTSLGMAPDVGSTPVPAECLYADMAVFDTVYTPPRTRLL
ncbi:MAG: type I 3-dehydroquinate dehydratase, partial [Phycisphaerae bacterium]|nr:type I 3-dehydroquinate dehydratase [Phycisphaerae bacterium]